MINVLNLEKLINLLCLYSVFLFWFMVEFFEILLEVGDLEKLKFVFFFDEVYLLFDGVLKILVDKIE